MSHIRVQQFGTTVVLNWMKQLHLVYVYCTSLMMLFVDNVGYDVLSSPSLYFYYYYYYFPEILLMESSSVGIHQSGKAWSWAIGGRWVMWCKQ